MSHVWHGALSKTGQVSLVIGNQLSVISKRNLSAKYKQTHLHMYMETSNQKHAGRIQTVINSQSTIKLAGGNFDEEQ